MKGVKLYDVFKLKDGKRYAVVALATLDSKQYLLLEEVISDSELSLDNFKYVECYSKDNKNYFKDVKDQKMLLSLGKIFASEIEKM